MITADLPENELERLNILKSFGVLDTDSEKDYDDMVKLASAICQTPISLVSLIDEKRQWFKARFGLNVEQTPREIAFCSHAILNDELFVVPNAVKDERFHDNPLVVGDPNIRFYAGMPLKTKGGHKLGTLCVIDTEPNTLTDAQVFALETLGRQVMNMLELRLKNYHLNRLNSLQNKFLAIISHDVRSPLVTMKSLVQMVESEDITPEDFKEISAQMDGHVSATIELLNNLIDWGASQSQGDKMTLKEFNIYDLAKSEVGRLQLTAKNKGLTLNNKIEEGATMFADVNMVKFIIRNLLTNAIKFTAEGSITISLEENMLGWKFTVSDTGIGIPDDKQEKLFNWEKRYTTNGTDNELGSGLGLLMCKEFTEKHFGKLTFESVVGEGTDFMVTINTKTASKFGLGE